MSDPKVTLHEITAETVRGRLPDPRKVGHDRKWVYILGMKKLFIALAIAGLMGLFLLVAGTAQNKGCLPWQTAVTTGGGAFSEGNRSQTFCR